MEIKSASIPVITEIPGECHEVTWVILDHVTMAKATNRTARRWCYTFYPKIQGSEDGLDEPEGGYEQPNVDLECVKFHIYQGESCPKTYRFHWQGYIILKNSARLSALKAWMPTAHWEIAGGTTEQNIAYCTKESTRYCDPVQYGDPDEVKQGARVDLHKAAKLIKEGKMLEVDHATYIKFHKGLHALAELHNFKQKLPKRNWLMHIEVIIGAKGKGKTNYAHAQCGDIDAPYVLSCSDSKGGQTWWNNYMGEPDIIINDFHGEIPFNTMLQLLDTKPYKIQGKGTMKEFLGKRIFITSTAHPRKWWEQKYMSRYDELERRITKITNMDDCIDHELWAQYLEN